jgi:hypothetical protein
MIVELNASPESIRTLLTLLEGKPELAEISGQLESALAQSDDDQSDEVPQEGDNEKIERME